MSDGSWTRVVLDGITADALADEWIAEPHFAEDPASYIGRATGGAAQAYGNGLLVQSAFYTQVGVLLCAASGREPGAVLAELAAGFGIS